MSEFDHIEFAKAMGAMIREAVDPLHERIRGLEGRDLVKETLESDRIETLVDLHVAAYLEANPPKDGDKGEKGDPGKDGLDVKDLFRADGGRLMAVMSDGTTKDLGQYVGKDGEKGKDGADFTEVEFDYDGERTLTIRGKGGEIVKRLPIPIDRGYWAEGKSAEKGDVLTHNGTAFIALRDTRAQPCKENAEDWRIMARGGRDGRHGRNGIDKTAPVKVNGDA